MNSVDCIKQSLEMSKNWIMGLAMDMKDEPLAMPTQNGGNHALWCLGHLAYSEGNLLSLARGGDNALADWEGMFKQGTEPSADASFYPSYDEVLGRLEEVRATTLEYINSLTDADLEKPSQAEGEMLEWFPTVGHCLLAIPIHFAFHGGQIAVARRAAGRPPLMG